jgi:peptide-methionine (R)-S-oxide reductase
MASRVVRRWTLALALASTLVPSLSALGQTATGDLPANTAGGASAAGKGEAAAPKKVIKTDKEWAKILTRPQFLVTRMKETEPAFSGQYVDNHARGLYNCVCCGATLFSSQTKFESGTGWPSFFNPAAAGRIDRAMDYTASEPRVEVMCSRCGAHLGHVFPDGPPPTGMRYCINSLSLKFVRDTTSSASASKKAAAKKGASKKAVAKKDEAKPDPSPSDAPPSADPAKATDPSNSTPTP